MAEMGKKMKYKVGDFVIYIQFLQAKNTNIFSEPIIRKVEFGIVKDVIERKEGGTEYRVLYHTGDTSALTSASHLAPITNASMIKEMIEKFGDLK